MKQKSAHRNRKRKLNLINNSTDPVNFRQVLNRALLNCLPMIFIISVGLLNARPAQRSVTPLSTFSQLKLFRDIREGSLIHAHDSSELSELRKNFLTNERIKNEELNTQFKDSGLAHLLALSGGQTAPAAQFFGTLFMFCLVAVLRTFKVFNITRSLNLLRALSGLLHTTILIFLVGLYQSTGALNRTLAEQINNSAKACTFLKTNKSPAGSERLQSISQAIPWLLGWAWHRNPVSDLSFLLSALGSTTSTAVSSMMRGILLLTNDNHSSSKPFISALTKTLVKLSSTILIGGLSCTIMSMLTWPLWPPGNIHNKIAANLLAGPCVLYLVTPATLGIAFSQLLNQPHLNAFAQQVLDLGLSGLMTIAQTFSESAKNLQPTAESTRASNLLQDETMLILNLEIIALMFLRELLCLRVKFQNRNAESRTSSRS